MNNKKIFLIITGWMFCLLCGLITDASAQDYPKFIGEGDPGVMIITPKHRITVWTGGFNLRHPKWAKKKTLNKCLAADLPESSCLAAQDYVQAITGFNQASTFEAEIDNAADHVISVWTACGEPYASFARRFDYSRITITVKDTIFQANGVWAGGMTADGGRTIWLVDLFFQPYFSDREHASPATMGQFANWEIGNAVTWTYLGHVRDTGDGSPCR